MSKKDITMVQKLKFGCDSPLALPDPLDDPLLPSPKVVAAVVKTAPPSSVCLAALRRPSSRR